MLKRTLAHGIRRLSFYDKTVEQYAFQEPHHLTVGDLIAKGSCPQDPIESAQYVHAQLPIRLAQTIRTIQSLPFIVGVNPYVNDVYYMYWDAFQVIHKFPPITRRSHAEEFSELLFYLLAKNKGQVKILAKGISEVRAKGQIKRLKSDYLDHFLDAFLREVLIRRILVATHIAVDGEVAEAADWVGIFRRHCKPAESLRSAMDNITHTCMAEFGVAPAFTVTGNMDATFMYPPSHLNFILTELLENSAQAVLTRQLRTGKICAPIEATIRKGDGLEIVISDEGGGLPKDKKEKIWTYGYRGHTPADEPAVFSKTTDVPAMPQAQKVAGGPGFGLPLARVYIKYLGGDIMLQSTNGYGCHCHLTFPPLKGDFQLT
mmetsp:Transcript_32491/g.58301  ORF Transcript_32491/g.58301 Transcript_32491/m.58301 type:complete len:374 (-) Transcript_32491:25-1146(-)